MTPETKHNRFKDLPWFPKEDIYVLIGGAGGIGSWTTFLLARMGVTPVVYDYDNVEEHNLGGQLYTKKHIGKSKVESMKEICLDFADTYIQAHHTKITKESSSHHYCISAFDNFIGRSHMFEKWAKMYFGNPTALFIDGRLEAEHMWIYCVKATPEHIEAYRATIMDDSKLEEAPCTARQTSHAAAMIASHIVGFFTNHLTNLADADGGRLIPFEWEYFIPLGELTNVRSPT